MAPEIFDKKSVWVSPKADVYSFGVLIYKLLYSKQEHLEVLDFDKLGNFNQLDTLIVACTQVIATSRPTMEDVVLFLTGNPTEFKWDKFKGD
uniref:Protein kinase domain-containing protein n=1 Tax=Meloidogyne enterolobii TaxID=390850 RepID=A0A6V7WFT6_MELEN|nr:unnamed protein product [Meloidogyne enterolobii]